MPKSNRLLATVNLIIAVLLTTQPLGFDSAASAAPLPVVHRHLHTVKAKVVTVPRTPSAARRHVKATIAKRGWGAKQWKCLDALWTHESGFRPNAFNKTKVGGKNAGGIPQILGLNPKSSVEYQTRKGIEYIESRYGTPCEAWTFWKSKAKYYDGDWHGGWY